jgi:hypothetical protein
VAKKYNRRGFVVVSLQNLCRMFSTGSGFYIFCVMLLSQSNPYVLKLGYLFTEIISLPLVVITDIYIYIYICTKLPVVI